MKYEILIGILFDLLSKDIITGAYISKKYDVSVRTAYRYIDTLSLAGIPVYTVRGQTGGYKIMENYRLSFSYFSIKEYEAVLSALKAVYDQIGDNNLQSAITKLMGVKKLDSKFSVQMGNLVIDEGPWCKSFSYKNKLTEVASAIEGQTVLKISYHDRAGQPSERFIEPHVLVFKQGMWYVFAFCRVRNEFRFFKIGRIGELTTMEEKFERKILPNELPFENWFSEGRLEFVELAILKPAFSEVGEWLGIENIEKNGENYVAKLTLPFDDSLVAKILSFGANVKVVSPKKLQDKIKRKIDEINSLYN